MSLSNHIWVYCAATKCELCLRSLADDDELNVMATIFEFAREVIKLKLTDTELSLMCALALIDPSK